MFLLKSHISVICMMRKAYLVIMSMLVLIQTILKTVCISQFLYICRKRIFITYTAKIVSILSVR